MSIEFLITAFVVVLIPGTGVLYTVSTALVSGFRAGIFAAVGCTLGIVPHLLASVLGLAAILHTSAVAFSMVKYAGVAYLLYLAYGMWKETGTFRTTQTNAMKSSFKVGLRGVLLNVLNPKLSIFFLAFLPQFIDITATSTLLEMVLLSSIFMAMTFVVFVGYAFFAHAVRAKIIENKRLMKWLFRVFAGAFVGLGVKLAMEER